MALFKKKIKLTSPMTGEIVDITDTSDPVFSGKMVGDGVTIIPTDGDILAPMAGKIIQMFDTGHALAIESNGIQVLIHIGLDTVELNGQGFTKIAHEGQEVKQGDLLIKVDLEKIKALGKSIESPMVIIEAAGKSLNKILGPAEKGQTVAIELK
uniref:PTS sugar transporter subunit IIA n=1 Tax=Ezakiella massiliensis TaxID=1852374 RepID=UPI00094F2985|nr:PTS glucose transporter subunit IIA [Ezakiella massiliensis]